jgi:hypothetical protein
MYFKNKNYLFLKLCLKWWCYWTSKTRMNCIFFMEKQKDQLTLDDVCHC